MPDWSFPAGEAANAPSASVEPDRLTFRPFGTEKSDLAVDFAREDVAALVTELLAQCAVGGQEREKDEFFRGLTVGKRLECLFRLAAGEHRSAFFFTFRCADCGEEQEFDLTLAEIVDLQRAADREPAVEIPLGGRPYVFRKPVGRDQEHWHESVTDAEAAASLMIDSLLTSPADRPPLDAATLERIAAAMDEADPLVNFECRVRCAGCGAANDFPLDLSEFALGELHRAQLGLLRAVHRLASHYHWSEEAIFAVPHRRRQKYLALIAAEK